VTLITKRKKKFRHFSAYPISGPLLAAKNLSSHVHKLLASCLAPGATPCKRPDLDARGPNIPQLLVEPFKDATGTAEGATIAIGLTEEVVEKLARFKDLIVVLSDPRRPDSLTFAAGTNSAKRYALAGSVRVEGDDIRLYARLIDRTKGSILWANSYDGSRTVRRLLDVEGDVARDVATALGQPYGTMASSALSAERASKTVLNSNQKLVSTLCRCWRSARGKPDNNIAALAFLTAKGRVVHALLELVAALGEKTNAD
jgi:TolB-like protein